MSAGAWKVRDTGKDEPRIREVESRSEAEETKSDMVSLGATPENIEILSPGEGDDSEAEDHPPYDHHGNPVESETDGGETLNPEVVENPSTEDDTEDEDLPDLDGDEPVMGLDICVHCEQEIEDGFCPDCDDRSSKPAPTGESESIEQLGESLDTDPLSILPGYMITHVDGQPSLNKRGVSVLAYHYGISVVERETVAYPHDTDHESAVVEIMVENEDGRRFVGSGEAHVDETPKHQLLRMAETRAYKRAVIFATGTGIVGYQEIMEELQ